MSVLIPAHNPGPYFQEALASVLGQLDASCELIVFDDASTDDTPAQLQDLGARYPGSPNEPAVRVLRSRSVVGVSQARNALLDAARGQWLWFVDADDRLRPGAVQSLRSVVHAQKDLQAVVVDHAVLRPRVQLKHRLRGEGHRRSMDRPAGLVPPGDVLMQALWERGQWHIWGKVVHRSAWPVSLRFPPQRVFEDLSVVPRLMAGITQAWYLAAPLIDYRSNPGSILGSMSPTKLRDWALALEDLCDRPEWARFVAQQAVRLVRVAQRLDARSGMQEAPGASPGEAPVGTATWVDAWWHRLCAHRPALNQAVRAWARQPRRWADLRLARQRGWLRPEGRHP